MGPDTGLVCKFTGLKIWSGLIHTGSSINTFQDVDRRKTNNSQRKWIDKISSGLNNILVLVRVQHPLLSKSVAMPTRFKRVWFCLFGCQSQFASTLCHQHHPIFINININKNIHKRFLNLIPIEWLIKHSDRIFKDEPSVRYSCNKEQIMKNSFEWDVNRNFHLFDSKRIQWLPCNIVKIKISNIILFVIEWKRS